MITLMVLSAVLAGPFPPLTEDGKPNIQSRAAVVIDLDTGKTLYARKADEVRAIASISKVMAALVVLDKGLDLEADTRLKKEDWAAAKGGPWGRLKPGWRINHRDLLEAALGASDNVAVIAMGRAVGLSPKAFGKAMTAKAKALSLKHMKFREPTGLSYRNKATAREVVVLLAEAMKRPELADILKAPTFSIEPVGTKRRLEYRHTVRPLWGGKWVILGGKTGFNKAAKYSVVMASRLKDGRRLGMAFLGADGKLTRFGDFGRVMHWLKEAPKGQTFKASSDKKQSARAMPKPDNQVSKGRGKRSVKTTHARPEAGRASAKKAKARRAEAESEPPRVRDEDAPPGWSNP
ncbi:MAG: D-alanyl-D-alanine carboxypeptidase family protein [Bradymonadia bacterium]